MGWLLGALLAIVLPGLGFAWWLTGDDYRGVHRHAPYAHRHGMEQDLDGPTLVVARNWHYRRH